VFTVERVVVGYGKSLMCERVIVGEKTRFTV
jgi:hypothetical protein